MRPLTSRERNLLEGMLRDDSTDLDGDATPADRLRWRAAVSSTFAVRGCECGTCPSIILTDAAGLTPGEDLTTRVVLETSSSAGIILLFIDDDQLSYLELAPWGDEPILEFPDIAGTTLRAHP